MLTVSVATVPVVAVEAVIDPTDAVMVTLPELVTMVWASPLTSVIAVGGVTDPLSTAKATVALATNVPCAVRTFAVTSSWESGRVLARI
jgi:hypothetical protein